jgi:hypothetical protein
VSRGRSADAILAAAPELAVAALVERALGVLVTTLRHRHPIVDDFEQPNDPRAVRRARRVIARAERMRDAIHGYASAVRCTYEPDSSDDLPF